MIARPFCLPPFRKSRKMLCATLHSLALRGAVIMTERTVRSVIITAALVSLFSISPFFRNFFPNFSDGLASKFDAHHGTST